MTRLLKTVELADLLGLSNSCVYKKAERGEIKSIKIGTSLRFSENDIQDFIDKCRNNEKLKSGQTIDYQMLEYVDFD